ncbi:DUF192 domain-containing protein [Halapricum sp. CBA1109]|uniref:DUF192 domain-containing protein n=1 Tax=Halapricum sp. CBA1109 TaxID=2668068 RepID=UPI0012FA4C9F|nr:DUF192 domain-containing protein [Halapricum sp. CBA1109]MUV88730.1 DUF192 domain-containing protein [Halapricum sp. CBA1109]
MVDRERALTVVSLALIAAVAALWLTSPTGPLAGVFHPLDYEETTVTLADDNGTELAAVDVRVAESDRELYVGLSETGSLDTGEGMLFVHDSPGEYGYVMRNMSFPLDILFVAENGTITTVHHAPVPGDSSSDDLREYPGEGRYVLEVPRGYANATGVGVGDRVGIPDSVTS